MKKFLSFVVFLVSIVANAQFSETLSSDRPGQALSGSTVGKNVFQIQSGIDFFESSSNFFPSSYFRYGFSEKFELNAGFVLSGHSFGNDLESFTIGARYRLNEITSKYQSSLQFSYDISSTAPIHSITYILGSSFSEKWSYTANFGVHFRNDFALDNFIYVFNLSYAINNKMGVFLEPFGTFKSGDLKVNLDAGVYYLLNNNLQLDALVGENDGLFVGAGVTWRIPSRK